ncbi:hypothetical protein EG328_011157 [Venturia inaequalis]|uniref:2'-phosphotransferase n=1 Tax=Venturia inaequalis TaxID=5025 RepID=A0A8H3VE93_VENIN|nr:hypothetical protein EG327_006731 [Venturia inaequalis]KAE9988397.1 hypothetical protein EG328_011157 [Venturia inaequalis]
MARGGGGGGRGPMTRDVQVSKKMSWLLRHGAEKEGLVLEGGGYVGVNDVNRNLKSLKVTFAELRSIVESNDKQRFSMIPKSEAPTESTDTPVTAETTTASVTFDIDNDDPSNFLIRANQGHSIKVEEEGLLEPISLDSELPSIVVHGTTHKAWPQIVASGGLKKMTRNHVHFASGLPAGFELLAGSNDTTSEAQKEPVISGMRNTSAVLIFIDIRKALEGGLKFWKSANGVILSDGDESGLIPLAYFARVEERKRGVGILVRDGEVVNELPEALTRGGDGGRRGGRGGRK